MTNKLGFYLHSFEIGEHKGDLLRAIADIRPPTLLVHAWDQVDQLRRLAPEAFIVGRMTHFGPDRRPVDQGLANEWLDSDDPGARGREFAQHILRDNFAAALRRENGRLLVDAWMSLNEAVPGPASGAFQTDRATVSRRLFAYDAFQAEFRATLMGEGVEAVAFNFGAGNFGTAEDYLGFFPRTLAEYTLLGFHEYGWPALSTELDPAARSSAGTYRPIVAGLRAATGRALRAIITELGLTAMFKHPDYRDVGWLDVPPPERDIETVSQDQYWRSLQWYNERLTGDDLALGACLFEVGHAGDWVTFRHFGTDNAGQPITIVQRIGRLAMGGLEGFESIGAPEFVTLRGRVVDGSDHRVPGAQVRLIGGEETLGGDPRAVIHKRGTVTWTRPLTGFGGSLWNCWQRYVAAYTAGITWEEFRAEFVLYNPSLGESDRLLTDALYFLPENRVFADTAEMPPEIVWDRTLTGFSGSLWRGWQRHVQGKVVGLNWPAFRAAVATQNPALAGKGARFEAEQTYRLPRNVVSGAVEYTRVAYTGAAGRFTFKNLRPGAYRLEVSASGFRLLVRPVDVEGHLEIVLPLLLPGLAFELLHIPQPASPFVQVRGASFAHNGRTLKFMGVNLRGLAHYKTETLPFAEARDQLNAARDMGTRVVRLFAPSDRVSALESRDRLGRLIQMMKQDFPEIFLLVALDNLYGDVPFKVPGDEGFYSLQPGGSGPHILNLDWFREGYKRNFLPFAELIVRSFRDEPVILGYNIGNELKAQEAPELLVSFMRDVATRLRQLDPNHLFSTGMISTRHAFMQGREDLRRRLYNTPLFDFITNHAYHIDGNDRPSPEDDSDLARALGKPLLIEEAGFVATNDRSPLYVQEMDTLFGQGASGYMPWGFMAGGNNGDGDNALGVDQVFHGADFQSLIGHFQARAQHLADQAVDVPVQPSGAFTVGQRIVTAAGARLRSAPGLSGQVLLTTPRRVPAEVHGGPQQQDNLVWWQLGLALDRGPLREGWMAQSAPNGTTLLSAT